MSGAGDDPNRWDPESGQARDPEPQATVDPADGGDFGAQAPPSFGGADGGPHWPGVARPAGWFLRVPADPPSPSRPETRDPESAFPQRPGFPEATESTEPGTPGTGPGTQLPEPGLVRDPATAEPGAWTAEPAEPRVWSAAAADAAGDPLTGEPADDSAARRPAGDAAHWERAGDASRWEPTDNPAAWEAAGDAAPWEAAGDSAPLEAAAGSSPGEENDGWGTADDPAAWEPEAAGLAWEQEDDTEPHAGADDGDTFPGPHEPGAGRWFVAGQDEQGDAAAYWYQDPDTGASRAGPAPGSPLSASAPSAMNPAVGPTSALRGQPGGPGFAVPPGMVAGLYDPARRSGWQQAQGLWRDSGIQWERPYVPASHPAGPQPRQPQPPQAQDSPQNTPPFPPGTPSPLTPRIPGASGSRPGLVRDPGARSADPNGPALGPRNVPLGAPTYADAPAPGTETGEADELYRPWEEPAPVWGNSALAEYPELTEYPELSRVPVRRGPRRRRVGLRALRVVLPVLVIVVVGVGAVLLLTGRTTLLLAAHGSRTSGTTPRSAPATAGGRGTPRDTANSGAANPGAPNPGTVAGGVVVPAAFAAYPGERGTPRLSVSSVSPVSPVGAANGELMAVGGVGGHPAIWRRGPGASWSLARGATSGVLLGRPGAGALTAQARGPAGWLAVGGAVSAAGQHPVVVVSADGATWRAADREPAFTGGGTYVYGAAAGRTGYVIVGKKVTRNRVIAATWWSPSLRGWTRGGNGGLDGRQRPSAMLAVAAGQGGFIAAGSHGSGPAVWTSRDGRRWTVKDVPSPAGASNAVLRQVAVNGALVVATGDAVTAAGTVPFAAVSANGGATWHEVSLPAPGGQVTVTALTASGTGFTAAGQSGPAGAQAAVVWTSADGSQWAAARPVGSQVRAITALASAGTTVTGVGFTLGDHPLLWTAPVP